MSRKLLFKPRVQPDFRTRNPFDVVGARAAGLSAIWVDKEGTGWIDRMTADNADCDPTNIVHSLRGVVELMKRPDVVDDT